MKIGPRFGHVDFALSIRQLMADDQNDVDEAVGHEILGVEKEVYLIILLNYSILI